MMGQDRTEKAKWSWESMIHRTFNAAAAIQCDGRKEVTCLVGTEDAPVQGKRSALWEKNWLEKHLISVISISRKVKENESRGGKLRNNLKNNQYPRYWEELWSHEYQVSRHGFAERISKTESQCTDGVKMDFLILQQVYMLHVFCFVVSLGLWSVMHVISSYARPVRGKNPIYMIGIIATCTSQLHPVCK